MSEISPKIPKIYIGVALVLVYFVLMFLAALQNPVSFDKSPFFWLAVVSLMGASFYFLYCVWRLHKALRAATGGSYSVSPVQAVLLHFVPFYIFYWVFRWTRDVVRFVDAATGERKFAFWVPGLIMFVGFTVGQAFDAGFSTLTNLLVVGWLGRLVTSALASPDAIANYQQSAPPQKIDMKKHGIAIAICVLVAIFVTAINIVAVRSNLADKGGAQPSGSPATDAPPAPDLGT